MQHIDLAGYQAFYCRGHLYLLANGFTSKSVKALIELLDNDKKFVPERIVLCGEKYGQCYAKRTCPSGENLC